MDKNIQLLQAGKNTVLQSARDWRYLHGKEIIKKAIINHLDRKPRNNIGGMMQKEYAYIADRLFRAKRLQIYAPIIADQNIKRSYSVLQILTAGAIETYKNT